MRKTKRHLSLWLAVVLASLAVLFVAFMDRIVPASVDDEIKAEEKSDLETYDAATRRKLWIGEMLAPHLERIERNYLEKMDDATLMKRAIAALYDLDRYSQFYPKKEYDEINIARGYYGVRVGITVRLERGVLVVSSVEEGSSARQRGIRVGDRLLAIERDGTMVDVKTVPTQEVEALLKGTTNSRSHLRVTIKGRRGPVRELTLERTPLPERTVHDARLDADGIAYIRVSAFVGERDYGFPSTKGELERAIRALIRRGTIHALILDLRGNFGGDFDTAVGVADLFLSRGIIVSIRGRTRELNATYEADQDGGFPGDILNGAPIIILADIDSASSSELVIGALIDADPKRATLVGTKTYGKGVAQSYESLSDGSGVKMTTHKFFTPKGRSADKKGFDPDVLIPSLQGTDSQGGDSALEKALELLRTQLHTVGSLNELHIQDAYALHQNTPHGMCGLSFSSGQICRAARSVLYPCYVASPISC